MRRQITLALVLALSLSGCWLQFRGDAAHTGTQPLGSPIDVAHVGTLTSRWSAPGAPVASSPAVSNDVVYIGSDDGRVRAFDATGVTNCTGTPTTCTPLWTATTGGAVRSSPAVANGAVIVGSVDGNVYAFDAGGTTNCAGTTKVCTPLWTAATGGPVESSPTVVDGVVYVGSDDGKLYAFSNDGTRRWAAATGGAVRSSPAVVDGVVYVGSDDGRLYAFDTTGTVRWTATTGGPVGSSPAVAGGVVFVGSDDGRLYAFDADGTTGCSGTPVVCTPLWTAATGGPVGSSPAVTSGTVVVGSDSGGLRAYDTTGRLRWTAPTGGPVGSSPAVVNDTVVVGSDSGTVTAYDATGATRCAGSPATCTATWTATTGGPVRSSPAVVGDAVYVGSGDGRLHVYGLRTAAATTTTLVSDSDPSATAAPVTFRATVSSATGSPTGSVAFTADGASMGSAPIAGGVATLTTSALAPGNHAVTARFSGNAAFSASTSSPVTQFVGDARFVDRNDTACRDSGTGTAGTPFCTINAAAQKATAGQTVTVAAGTYLETVTVGVSGTSTAPVTFTAAPGATVTVSGGTFGFSMTGRSWVVIRGFSVTNTASYGIRVTGCDHVTLDRNHVSAAGQPVSGLTAFGIGVNGTTRSTVTGNVTDHNSDAGISLAAGSDTNLVTGNESSMNARGYTRAAAGIDVRNSTGNVVTANRVHDNEDSGINAWTGTTNGSNTFSDNVVARNGDHGIDVHDAVDARVVANTVVANTDSGIESTTSTGTYVAGNVSVDNGISSPRTSGQIRVDGASAATAVVTGDLVWMRVSGVMFDWDGVRYSSLDAFRSATGQESRGIEADPRFRAPESGDLHLLAGSAAIDSSDSGAPGEPATDADGAVRIDDPATPDTGIGPITYADRGAFEFRT